LDQTLCVVHPRANAGEQQIEVSGSMIRVVTEVIFTAPVRRLSRFLNGMSAKWTSMEGNISLLARVHERSERGMVVPVLRQCASQQR